MGDVSGLSGAEPDYEGPGRKPKILLVCGLVAEAKLARGPHIEAICSGGDVLRLERTLRACIAQGCAGLVSFGIAGGLSQRLKAGSLIVADAVIDGRARYPTYAGWSARLMAEAPGAIQGMVLGSNSPVANPFEKDKLFIDSGALAVDMESHIVARLGAEYRLPVAVLRAVSDPAGRALPPAALAGMKPDGSPDILAVLKLLLFDPSQLPALIATAREVSTAMRALKGPGSRIERALMV